MPLQQAQQAKEEAFIVQRKEIIQVEYKRRNKVFQEEQSGRKGIRAGLANEEQSLYYTVTLQAAAGTFVARIWGSCDSDPHG